LSLNDRGRSPAYPLREGEEHECDGSRRPRERSETDDDVWDESQRYNVRCNAERKTASSSVEFVSKATPLPLI
jgi:hypothetical protein